MRPKIEGLIDPGHEHRLAVMRTAMARAGVSAVPTNREQRRRLNAELRALGAPELQVSTSRTPEKYRHAPEQDEPVEVDLD